jgi:hypothetical protein
MPKRGKPSGVPWGPVVAYPEIDVTLKSNDNIYSQPASGTRKSANITVIAPKLKIEAKDGPHTYDATYGVEHGSYSGVSSANYTDQKLGANATWVFSGRSGLKLGAEYMLGHDDQGAVPGAATHANPDKYHQTSFNALAGYGAEGAQGSYRSRGGPDQQALRQFQDGQRGKSRTTPSATVMMPSLVPRSTGVSCTQDPGAVPGPCKPSMTTSRRPSPVGPRWIAPSASTISV